MLQMERITRNKTGSFDVYAGQLGHHIATTPTKKAARESLDDWHYFHPQERAEQQQALVNHILGIIIEASETGDLDAAVDMVHRMWGSPAPVSGIADQKDRNDGNED